MIQTLSDDVSEIAKRRRKKGGGVVGARERHRGGGDAGEIEEGQERRREGDGRDANEVPSYEERSSDAKTKEKSESTCERPSVRKKSTKVTLGKKENMKEKSREKERCDARNKLILHRCYVAQNNLAQSDNLKYSSPRTR